MMKVQSRNIKKNRIMVCFALLLSVVLSISAPFSITSYASSIGIPLGVSVDSYLAAFYSFLLGNGFAPDEILNPFSSSRVDANAISDVFTFYDDLNNYKEGLGDEVESAVLAGTLDGKLLLTEEGRQDLLEYLDLMGTITLFDDVRSLPLIPANSQTTITINYRLGTSPDIYSDVVTITSPSDYVIVSSAYNSDSYYQNLYVVNKDNVPVTISVSKGNSRFSPTYVYQSLLDFRKSDNTSFSAYAGNIYFAGSYNGNSNFYQYDSFLVSAPQYSYVVRLHTIVADIFWNLIHSGTASYSYSATATSVTNGQEVVSSASTVSDQGELEGGYQGVVIPLDTLNQLINAIKSGVLTVQDAFRTIGLNTVAPDATAEEKQQAINNIVEVVPASSITNIEVDSSGITASESKVGTLTHIEHAIANAIALATGQALPYPDEDPDYVPPGDPHIENWEFPSLDPSDPDPGGSEEESTEDRNRAADVADGISVVAGLASDIFDSASGFNLVTTVGYSFVIFSAILGASHFFGALGGRHDDVRSHPLDWNRSERWSSKQTDFKSDW